MQICNHCHNGSIGIFICGYDVLLPFGMDIMEKYGVGRHEWTGQS